MAKMQGIGRLAWKSGLCLLAAVAVVQFIPSPVPARDAPMHKLAPASAPAQAPAQAAPTAPASQPSAPEASPPAPAPTAPGGPVAVADYPIHSELPVQGLLRQGQWAWTEGEVPSAGETLVVVNLRAQLLSLYRGGYEVGRARIIYGADEKPTPTGTFPILQKDAVHFSNLYGGAPMPYMLRLTNDGVSIHGSGEMADDLVTHGCVGLPKEFAAMLFRQVKVGDRVVVWRG